MTDSIKNQGPRKLGFTAPQSPPCFFKAINYAAKSENISVFEPYEENLPLEAGFYTFVLDTVGNFFVKRGNYSSHASMIGREKSTGAGNFQINSIGETIRIHCISRDYRIKIANSTHRTVRYIVNSFKNHSAFTVHEKAIFKFAKNLTESFEVDQYCEPIIDRKSRMLLLTSPPAPRSSTLSFTEYEIELFKEYSPDSPQRLYVMHQDQATEPDGDYEDFEFGPGKPIYSPAQPKLTKGWTAFIIDRNGWLVVGNGHHILSGGADVGAAGHLGIDEQGFVEEIRLNFSGHYRPILDASYARYTFWVLLSHPLLRITTNCKITARKFDSINEFSRNLLFSQSQLIDDDEGDLEMALDCIDF